MSEEYDDVIYIDEFELKRISDDSFFLQHVSGEGMEIGEAELVKMFTEYWEENF